ncbi:ATP-binding protein involved in chromosome partitioning [Anseongella ginsenosidimutans]|uniref:Iron-sulfur cluster carrier protein n=1 Tax=Anseongella ginsenosidimutans TaxID=496056 RepID=A0A4R3KN23_9SPHI|nr:Mrp/NBP35 family ATP-binding protein [Anseongella ginsenosidimutans]QEC52058.1 Mrp/NBP35 family ATP-binding protein [Anseongella ginsenosidimutans]TCS85631.1 ATP-binding protein involved in chromosome partitioning [Anseongella ginsenosidimutans]
MNYTKEQVLNALKHVQEPDLKQDLVTLNMIEDIHVQGNKISFTVILTTPACPLQAMIEKDCRNAIREYVSPEAEVEVKMTARVTTRNANMFPNIKNIIIVSSGKGGVGKSTVASNLALALYKKGAKVGLLDADIYGPSIPMMFGVMGARPDVKTENGKHRMLPIEKHGIKLLSIGFFATPGQAIPWRGPMVSSAVKQLFNDADWGELDYLVVDFPPGTGDIHITVAQGFPVAGAVLVTTPQNVALADAAKGAGMFRMDAINIPILGVVENMSWFSPAELPDNKYYIFGKGGGKALAEQFDVPLLGEIPLVKAVSDAGDTGSPLVLDDSHPVSGAFLELAERVAQQVAISNSGINEPVVN